MWITERKWVAGYWKHIHAKMHFGYISIIQIVDVGEMCLSTEIEIAKFHAKFRKTN